MRRNTSRLIQALWVVSLALIPIASEANAWGARRDQLFVRLDALPRAERSTAILMAYQAINANSSKLEMETAKKASDALKVVSIEYSLLAGFAERAQWQEMSAWFAEGAELYTEIIRGHRRPDSEFSAMEQVRNRQYATIVRAERSRLQSSMTSDPSPAMTLLAEDMAKFIGASARMYVWRNEPQASEP